MFSYFLKCTLIDEVFSYFLKCTLIDVNGNYFAMQNMACKTFTIAIEANCYCEYFACEITDAWRNKERESGLLLSKSYIVEAATSLATTTNDWANFISGQG